MPKIQQFDDIYELMLSPLTLMIETVHNVCEGDTPKEIAVHELLIAKLESEIDKLQNGLKPQ